MSAVLAAALVAAAPHVHAACSDVRSIPFNELEHTDAYAIIEFPQAGENTSIASLKAELVVTDEVRQLVLASIEGGCQQTVEWTENGGYDLYVDEYKDAFASYWSASKVFLRLGNGVERPLLPTFSMQAHGQNQSSSDRVEFNRVVVLGKNALKRVQKGATLAMAGQAQTIARITVPTSAEYATSFVNFVGVPRLVVRLP